ncbi:MULTISPECIES: hypothetical protein [Streptomyces]|uniref:hypothetical protein n=1 Tax=Streptomyces TaxID=1883 RepID=UPI000CD4FD02|nr:MULTISPECIES: hypothetical protein [Streptomyces]
MPLHALPAPVPAERCLSAALRSSSARSPHEPHGDRAALRPILPLPLYLLDPVAPPGGVPQLAGWRFLLARGALAVSAAETTLTADGWAFSHFFEGPFIASTEQALAHADQLAADYQPRLLSVPRLYMLTLWLHADVTASAADGGPGADDLLVPLAPAPPGIASHQPLSISALLPLLSNRLTTRLVG